MRTRAQCFLVTHTHADHYDEDMVREYLLAHPECIFIGPAEVRGVPARQQRLAAGEGGHIVLSGITVTSVRLDHEGEEYRDVTNFGYAVRCADESLLVLGDAAIADTARGLAALTKDGPVTAAALDFPVFALARGRAALRAARAENLIGIHLPFPSDDKEGYRESAARALSHVNAQTSLPAMLLQDINQCIDLG